MTVDKPAIGAAIGFGCAAICVALAYAMTLIRTYGPVLREAIHATVTPQFAAGMFFMAALVCMACLLFAWGER